MRILLISLIFLSGCSALKEKTGEFVTEAVVDKIRMDFQNRLDLYDIKVDELQNSFDTNADGHVSRDEIAGSIRDTTQDFVVLQTKNFVDEKIKNIEDTNAQQDSKFKEYWNWLLGSVLSLVSAYLGKQVVSAKKDAKRDTRIALLEKALKKDLDGDGKIGD